MGNLHWRGTYQGWAGPGAKVRGAMGETLALIQRSKFPLSPKSLLPLSRKQETWSQFNGIFQPGKSIQRCGAGPVRGVAWTEGRGPRKVPRAGWRDMKGNIWPVDKTYPHLIHTCCFQCDTKAMCEMRCIL